MENKYFGTDGVRGIAGDKLTSTMAYRIGRYLGQYPRGKKNRILIAADTRISGDMLKTALASGIMASGSDVYLMGVSTTPSISYLVREKSFDYGIMISASHNPYYDNGIKIFNSQGEKLENDIEKLIEGYMDSILDDLPYKINESVGRMVLSHQLVDEYVDFLAKKAHDLSGLHVIVDGANGSASVVAPKLFQRLGLTVKYINITPNGVNINDRCGSTHLKQLQTETRKNGFQIGLAFDGDADRLMVVCPDGQVADGDAIIYLNALDMKKRGLLNDNKVVITVMSNIGLKVALQAAGIALEEVQVGDKYVQACLKEHHLSLGGEQSGHIIFLDDLNTGDGLLTAIKVMNVLKESNRPLSELLSGLKIYPQILKNVSVVNKDAVMAHTGLKELIGELSQKLNGNGRILVRASGTEPLVRVMAEAPSIEECERVVSSLVNYIGEISY